MEPLRRAAFAAASRAFGFSGLAIFCSMIGMSFDPVTAARTGGTMMTLLTVAYLIMAYRTFRDDYRRTEAWIILSEKERPAAAAAATVVANVRREAFLWFARLGAVLSVALWSVALLLRLVLPS